jgi:hypothetical protein
MNWNINFSACLTILGPKNLRSHIHNFRSLDKLAWTTALKAYNIVGASSKSIIGMVIHYILNSMASKSAKDSLTEDEDGSTSSLSTLDSSPTPPNSPSFQISEDCHVKIERRSSKCRNLSSPVVRRTSLRNAQSPPTTADWADPETSKWDVRRVLMSDECLANDPLLELPSPDHSYIDN